MAVLRNASSPEATAIRTSEWHSLILCCLGWGGPHPIYSAMSQFLSPLGPCQEEVGVTWGLIHYLRFPSLLCCEAVLTAVARRHCVPGTGLFDLGPAFQGLPH